MSDPRKRAAVDALRRARDEYLTIRRLPDVSYWKPSFESIVDLVLEAVEKHDITGRMLAAADSLDARIAACHKVVACPTCMSPRGVRCSHLVTCTPLKHPHTARVRSAGIPLR